MIRSWFKRLKLSFGSSNVIEKEKDNMLECQIVFFVFSQKKETTKIIEEPMHLKFFIM